MRPFPGSEYVLLRNDGYAVMAHPEVDLDDIGHHLRGCHELAVPWLSVVRGTLEETLCFFAVEEGQDG